MDESPLLKHARRKMAERRQFQMDSLDASRSSQRKGMIKNIVRGVVLLVFILVLAVYFSQFR